MPDDHHTGLTDRHDPMHLGADDDEVPFWLQPPPPRPSSFPASVPPPVPPSLPTVPPPSTPAPPYDGGPPTDVLPVLPEEPPPATHQSAATEPQPALADRLTRTLTGAGGMLAAAGATLAAAGTTLGGRLKALPRTWLVGAAAAASGVVVVAILLALLGGGPDAGTGTGTARATPSGTPKAVAASLITASASSTQGRAGSTSYDAANTLDGTPGTAWNSDGSADGPGPGITLTYRFAAPVDLRAISLTNGYQKVVKRSGRTLDLYSANSRVRRVTVVTDTGSWTWDLKDVRTPQPLRKAFGTTRSVTLKIVTVYKGAKYTDVGVSDVAFTGIVQR